MRMSVETLIDAPPQLVFPAIADIESWSSMISAISAIVLLTPGPVAVGTRFRETREMLGRKATEEMMVAEVEPPRRLVLTASRAARGVRGAPADAAGPAVSRHGHAPARIRPRRFRP